MQIPTIHLNGTGINDLSAEYKQAIIAIRKARTAVQNMTVHQRDYYVKPEPTGWRLAQEEHVHHLAVLDRIEHELTEVWIGIENQRTARDLPRPQDGSGDAL